MHYYHTASHTTPINRDTAKLLATPPPGIDKTLWLYELCRFLIAQCNTLIVGFLFDTPPCSAATCPEMRAGEWQFLCAVHDTPKSCCAIDYCCHTLDWAANVVTNPKIFPSRFVVDAHDKSTALKNLVNVFRRLHRIFAHAWFQHRGVFWSLESQSGLYVFFKTVCDVYDLLPAENYKLPPEAEGLDSAGDLGDRSGDRRHQASHQQLGPISIAKPPRQRDSDEGDYSATSRTNTRRHIKSSPSVGSAVTTVPEADEDESVDLSHRLGGMRISGPTHGEEGESASIPVIVEHRPITAGEQPIRPSSVIPPPETAVRETQPSPEPVTAMPEAAPSLEHEFAAEPELPSQPEPAAEQQQKSEEKTEAEEPGPKTKDAETETEPLAKAAVAPSSEASSGDKPTATAAEDEDDESKPSETEDPATESDDSDAQEKEAETGSEEESGEEEDDDSETKAEAEDKKDESEEEKDEEEEDEAGEAKKGEEGKAAE